MIKHRASFPVMCRSLWQHRRLIVDFARRDALGRYKGSLLGVVWSLVTPLFMLGIYTFVFSHVFKARWGVNGDESRAQFAILLFAGLIIFNFFSECVGRAPMLILNNQNFVKKVVFPLEILPCASLLSSLFHACVSLTVLLVFEWCANGAVPLTALLIPLVFFPLILLILGASWWLAATGVYLRDIGQSIGVFLTCLMFVSPIFFPSTALPEKWRGIARMNPLAFPIEQARKVLIFGSPIDWGQWCAYTVFSALVAWLGFVWFQKMRKGFADVL
ncbi:ABC transporter permease [Herbaspirillum sp. RTI4]|uniref:ABC transporter permease n=1 Tax=Herbaspirillum sp. RTI4 TaxID=3048640 RepID=UPI002AB38259|nr:ABC transporter permease [Herbaspirillum sp. RTI4]MDY7577605.1 ABC transporter permease [Herbaspirillum sp. RTI4]MEA9983276.1 ABC transporter permease [Herbaspirillum sp. RTI4]